MYLVEFHYKIWWRKELIITCLNYLVKKDQIDQLLNSTSGYQEVKYSKVGIDEAEYLKTKRIFEPVDGWLVNRRGTPIVIYMKMIEKAKMDSSLD